MNSSYNGLRKKFHANLPGTLANRTGSWQALYDYAFPDEQIALEPAFPRDHSRLWLTERERCGIQAQPFFDLPRFLSPGDCLVVNNVKVLPVRLQALRRGEGRSEILLINLPGGQVITSESGWIKAGEGNLFEALISRGRKIRMGTLLRIGQDFEVEVLGRAEGDWTESQESWLIRIRLLNEDRSRNLFADCGAMPLPPYIRKRLEERKRSINDLEAYQSVFASSSGGAIAAPTAGLHFTPELLARLKSEGVVITPLTLYISFATFRPIRSEDLGAHRMHSEAYEIPEESAAAVHAAKRAGKKVIAVGTTVTRALEAAARDHGFLHEPRAVTAKTDLFIQAGFEFRVIDGLLTNFHQPRSSLLVLACAFAGREALLENYQRAIAAGCRLFSYGDAMLIA